MAFLSLGDDFLVTMGLAILSYYFFFFWVLSITILFLINEILC